LKLSKSILILIIISLNLLVFLPSINGGFVWDDRELIEFNSSIENGNFMEPFQGSFGKGSFNAYLYRPVVSLSYKIDYMIYGLNPFGFHLTNIIINIANSILIFFIIFYLFKDYNSAFFISILFSVFPPHFENVSWISGRTDLLALMFSLLAVLLFVKFIKTQNNILLYISQLIFFVSILSKEISFLMIFLLIYYLFIKNDKLKKKIKVFSGYFIFILIYFILKFLLTKNSEILFSIERIDTFFSLIGFYFKKLLFPYVNTVSINELILINDLSNLIVGILITLVFIYFNFRFFVKEKNQNIFFFFYSMSFILLTFYSLIVFFNNVISIAGFRFLYFPSLFFISFIVLLISRLVNKKLFRNIFFISLILIFSINIYSMNRYFSVKKEDDFWKHFKTIKNESIMIKFNYASSILQTDEKRALRIFKNILKDYEGHINYEYYKKEVYETFASYYTNKKDIKKAEYYFKKLNHKKIRIDTRFDFFYFLYIKGERDLAKGMARDFYEKYKNFKEVKYFYYMFLKKINSNYF